MGIKSLSTILNNYAKNSIKNVTLDSFRGKIISIDTSIFLYKYLYNNCDFIDGFTRQILRLLKNGIIPLYIFDGKPPEEKQDILNDRKERKEFLIKKKKLLEKILKGEEVQDEVMQKYIYEVKEKSEKELSTELQKVKKKIIYVTGEDIENAKKLFQLFGVPYIEANGEAETYCAVLTRNGYTCGCITEDTDYLACGGNNFIRGFNSSTNNVILYKIKDILGELDMTFDQFIDMCILCGCDYTCKIVGIGAVKAYKFIKKYKTIEGVIEKVRNNTSYKIPENFDYIKARELLRCKDTFDLTNICRNQFKIKFTEEDELIKFLEINSPKLKKKYYTEIRNKLKIYKKNCLNKNTSKRQKKISTYFEKNKYFIKDDI